MLRIHEPRGDPIGELPLDVRIVRKVDPAELLQRGLQARHRVVVERLAVPGERNAIPDGPEHTLAGLAEFDREADEIDGWLACAPIHGEQCHAVAAMDFEREERFRVLADDLEFGAHEPSVRLLAFCR
ncbi:MAG: hypothetical protein U0132_19975 [Gemmatimonadaceae bacterium]